MSTYNVSDAKTHLSQLLDRAAAGEEVVITRRGQAVVRLVPVEGDSAGQAEQDGQSSGRRPLGIWRGRVWIAPDFDELPEEIAAAFRGERP